MIITAKALVWVLLAGVVLPVGWARAAEDDDKSVGEILFKIHDVVPEKDVDGKVLYCNVGATFFNRTSVDVSNVALSLLWNDEVIGETIDQEERADKEQRRTNPNAARSRYSTSGFTSKTVSLQLKLPPLKSMQQVSLKTKVDTDRCFLLLNDMDIKVTNCGTAAMNGKVSRQGCDNLFRYVSPMNAEYYTEFKEVSLEQQLMEEDKAFDAAEKELDKVYQETLDTIKNITAEVSGAEE